MSNEAHDLLVAKIGCLIRNAELRFAHLSEWLVELPAGKERDAISTRLLAAHNRLNDLRAELNFETTFQ